MSLYKLDKRVYVFKDNPESLLKGISTNILSAAKNAFVTRNGKIIAVADQLYVDGILSLVIDSSASPAFEEMVKRYLPLVSTTMERSECNVYYDCSSDFNDADAELVFPQSAGRVIVAEGEYDTISDEEFIKFRLNNNIPLHGVDFFDEMLLDVFDDGYISYTKGCFTGQEILARVHNLAKPTKRLVVVNDNEISSVLTSRSVDENGVTRGFSFIANE